MNTISDQQGLMKAVAALTVEAGQKIMTFFEGDRAGRMKENSTPVTDADVAAHEVILAGLKQLAPGTMIISEEDEHHLRGVGDGFWLVDPLDGTKSFIRGTGEFTVNIAWIEKGLPVFGAVYSPRSKALYYGGEKVGAFRQLEGGAVETIQVRIPPAEGVTVVVSHSHLSKATEAFLQTLNVAKHYPMASSFKFCILADGKADLYPRHGPTMEWDTAAGHAVLEGAGGQVLVEDGTRLRYGKEAFENPYFFAYGKKV